MNIKYWIILFFVICFSCGKSDKKSIYLKQIDLSKENKSRCELVYSLDSGINLIKLDRFSGIDDFTTNYIFVKENDQLAYQVENISGKINQVVSKDYFAFVNPY